MNTKGFTLVEVLIGLFIAVIASAYVAKTIANTNKVVAAGRDTFIATNLAHDGIDLSRAMRDNTWFTDTTPLNRSEWMLQSGICGSGAKYIIDTEKVRNFAKDITKLENKVQSVSGPAPLYIQSNKLWTHAVSSTPTAYSRVLEADCTYASVPLPGMAYVTITSTVSWVGQNGVFKSVSLKEQLYNWLP